MINRDDNTRRRVVYRLNTRMEREYICFADVARGNFDFTPDRNRAYRFARSDAHIVLDYCWAKREGYYAAIELI